MGARELATLNSKMPQVGGNRFEGSAAPSEVNDSQKQPGWELAAISFQFRQRVNSKKLVPSMGLYR
jgi:hypothetical protein